MSDDRYVYSTDADEQREIERRAAAGNSKRADDAVDPTSFVVRIRMERAGRGGKIVTIAAGFPANEFFLKALTKKLKKACGTGGTFKIAEEHGEAEGAIEIQGDRREDVRKILERDGLRTKGR